MPGFIPIAIEPSLLLRVFHEGTTAFVVASRSHIIQKDDYPVAKTEMLPFYLHVSYIEMMS